MTRAVSWRAQKRRIEAEKLRKIEELIKAETLKVSFDRIYTMTSWDVPDIKWVERFIVGTSSLNCPLTDEEISKQMDAVNKALRYGKIIAVEQNFNVTTVENKDIIAQYTVYHVGFRVRPRGR